MELRVRGKRVFAGTGGRAFDPALPAAVFIHGAGMDHTVWALQTRSFAHHGRSVLALDLPGHGGSEGPAVAGIPNMAEWVLEVLRVAGARRVRIAGHSMGSLVALEAARAGAHRALDLMVSWSFGAQARFGNTPAPGLWLSGEALRLLERSPAASLAADLVSCAAYKGAAEAAARVRCPTLLLLGAEDRMTPAAKGRAFAERIAGARVTVLPGIGHMMMIEDPSATLAALKTIL
jgi:pimeloyl-ACP methyl ester carboxylesterase